MGGEPYYFSARLMARLRSLDAKGIAYVEAPVGYGKTVAVRHYLRINRFPVIWVSALDSGPKKKDLFWRDFCGALMRRFPQQRELLESLRHMGYPDHPPLVETALGFLEQLPVAQPTVLVIDDLHFLQEDADDTPMLTLCELLAVRGKIDLRLVLVSRHAYGDRGALLRLKGLLDIIPAGVFALNAEEIVEYFRMCGADISKAAAHKLHKATGGWISALYLTLLRHRARGDHMRASEITDLLRQEVYLRLAPWERLLSVWLSPLEQFTEAHAAFVASFLNESGGGGAAVRTGKTGRGSAGGLQPLDASAMLRKLASRNAFISYRADTGTYAMHTIFRDFLRELFMQLQADLRRAIQRQHAAWFSAHGDCENALVFLFACGDFKRALEMLEAHPHALLDGHGDFCRRFFHDCPRDLLLQYPSAAFKFAFLAFSEKEHATFSSLLDALELQCGATSPENAEAGKLRGEMEMLRSLSMFNDIEAMAACHRRAYALLQGPSRYFGLEPWTFGSPSVLFLYHRQVGKLEEEVGHMLECLPEYYKLTDMHGAGGEYQMQAEASFYAGEFDKAEVACQHALVMSRKHGQLCVEICARMLQSRLMFVRGKPLEAESFWDEILSRMSGRRELLLLRAVDLCKAALFLSQGKLDEIPEWLWRSEDCEKNTNAFTEGISYLVHGRILLQQQKYEEVLGFSSWILAAEAFRTKIFFPLYAHMYMAAAHAARGSMELAAASLRAALALAIPDRLCTPFAELWEYLSPVFAFVAKESIPADKDAQTHEYIAALGALWLSRKRSLSGWISVKAANPPRLTKREMQLVRLATTGKTYPEIAEILALAPNTVKKTFGLILRKNGLTGRHQLRELLERLPPQA